MKKPELVVDVWHYIAVGHGAVEAAANDAKLVKEWKLSWGAWLYVLFGYPIQIWQIRGNPHHE
jgi:hypothetical protein